MALNICISIQTTTIVILQVMTKHLLVLAVAIFTLAAATTAAAAAAPVSPRKSTGDFLSAHNKVRVSAKVHPLSWSPNLALKASQIVQDQANLKTCNFAKLPEPKYGLNKWRSIGLLGCAPQAVVDWWMEEKANYNDETKSCFPDEECRSYLQVVARNTGFLGCGEAACNGTSGGCLAVCLYNPPARGTA